MKTKTVEEKFIRAIHSAVRQLEKDILNRQIDLALIDIRKEERRANKIVNTQRSRRAK